MIMSEMIMNLFRRLNGTVKTDNPPSGGYLYQDEDIGGVNIMYHTELETKPKRKLTQEQKDRYNKTKRDKRAFLKENFPVKYEIYRQKENERKRNSRKR